MPLPLVPVIGVALGAFARKVFGGIVLSKVFGWVVKIFVGKKNPVTGKVSGGWLGKSWDKLRDIVFNLGTIGWVISILEETGKKILGIVGLTGAVGSGSASVMQIPRLLSSINDPQKALLDYIHGAMQHLPYTFSSILNSVDGQITSMTSGIFTPSLSLTYMLRVTGIGEAFNQILMSVIQGAVFVFSVYLVRWAFSSNFTYVKTDPKPKH